MFGNTWVEGSEGGREGKEEVKGARDGRREGERERQGRKQRGKHRKKEANELFLVIVTFSLVMILLVLPMY